MTTVSSLAEVLRRFDEVKNKFEDTDSDLCARAYNDSD